MPLRRLIFVLLAGMLLTQPYIRRRDRALVDNAASVGADLGRYVAERHLAAEARDRKMVRLMIASIGVGAASVLAAIVAIFAG